MFVLDIQIPGFTKVVSTTSGRLSSWPTSTSYSTQRRRHQRPSVAARELRIGDWDPGGCWLAPLKLDA